MNQVELANTLRNKVKKYYVECNEELYSSIQKIIREMTKSTSENKCCQYDCSCSDESDSENVHPYCDNCSPANEYYTDSIYKWKIELIRLYKNKNIK